MHDLSGLLDHRSLIDTDRYSSRTERSDIGSLTDRICEETYRSSLLVLIIIVLREAPQLDFLLDCRIPLKSLHSDKVHIMQAHKAQEPATE